MTNETIQAIAAASVPVLVGFVLNVARAVARKQGWLVTAHWLDVVLETLPNLAGAGAKIKAGAPVPVTDPSEPRE